MTTKKKNPPLPPDTQVEVREAANGTGYRARIVVAGRIAYDSEAEHDDDGRFPTQQIADRHARRYLVALKAKRDRVAELRQLRTSALPDRLARSMDLEADHEATRKRAGKRIKEEREARAIWIEEIRHPRVELHFSPSAEDFSILDLPAASDGTATLDGEPVEDPRQQMIPGVERKRRSDEERTREVLAWLDKRIVALEDELGGDIDADRADEIRAALSDLEQQRDDERAKLDGDGG